MIKDCFATVTCGPCDRSQVFASSMRWPRQAGRHRHVRLIAALLASAPDALVLADARPPALLAFAPDALVLAEARPPALLALAPLALVLAQAALACRTFCSSTRYCPRPAAAGPFCHIAPRVCA